MINQNGTFIAEVRNINDPYASGRYQLRIYGNHNDEQNIKDEHLPWGQFIQHAGSAATSKIGILPTGPIVGSRVYGTFLDEAKQYPIILGTFPRGAMLQGSNADVGQSGLDSNSYGADSPVINGSSNGNFGLAPNAPGLNGTAVNPLNAQFNQAPFVTNDQGSPGLDTARQMHAPNADQPTIAATDPTLNLPSALQQVGSNAQVLPMMVSLLSQVQSMMNMNNSAGNNPTNSPSTNNLSGVDASLGIAFGKILVRISYHLGFDYTINVLSRTFGYNYYHVYNLAARYQAPVVQGILYLIQNYANYTEEEAFVPPSNVLSTTNVSNTQLVTSNIVSTYTSSNVIFVNPPLNAPQPLLNSVPKFYIQRYYIYTVDPYPGYIQWLGPAGNYVFTLRTSNNPNYASSTDDITGGIKVQMYDLLFPFFQTNSLRADTINNAFNLVSENADNAAMESNLGSESSDDILGSAIAILGEIGGMITSANSQHLPNSVLNQQSMSNTLNTFTQNIGALQQMKNISNTAFNPVGILGMISSLFSGSQMSTTSFGSLSTDTFTMLVDSGVDSQYVTSINSLITNNYSITANNIATIASVTKQLQDANASYSVITDVQTLLAEIITANGVTNNTYVYVPSNTVSVVVSNTGSSNISSDGTFSTFTSISSILFL